MPPSGEKMWHTNYMDEYNKKRPRRKAYDYRKPILKKTTPKATEIHIPTSYISEPQVLNTKPGKEPKLELVGCLVLNVQSTAKAVHRQENLRKKEKPGCLGNTWSLRNGTCYGILTLFHKRCSEDDATGSDCIKELYKRKDFVEPRPHTSQGFYQNELAVTKAFNEYFKNLSLRGPDNTAVQDGHPSTCVPMFLDSYFPMSLSDIPSQEYYMWCLLNAANAAKQKTQAVPKPPSTSRPQTARQRPKTARPTTAKSRPQTSHSRPKTAGDRPQTANNKEEATIEVSGAADVAADPINASTDVDVLNLEQKEDIEENFQSPLDTHSPSKDNYSENLTKPQEYHWLCWPEPKPRPPSPTRRPHTVLGIHTELPRYGNSGPDIEDRTDSPEPSYVFGVREESTRGPPMTFVPDLQSWINAASDYEKAVIYKMMQTMNGSHTPLPPPSLRPRRETTYTFGSNRVNSHPEPNPMNPYAQAWQPKLQHHTSVPMAHAMNGVEQLPSLQQMYRSNTDLRPASRRVVHYPMSEDYTHEHSMFMTTQPLCRGHFIIHPDWVSERMRRKPAIPFKKYRGQGMRYGTK